MGNVWEGGTGGRGERGNCRNTSNISFSFYVELHNGIYLFSMQFLGMVSFPIEKHKMNIQFRVHTFISVMILHIKFMNKSRKF